MIAQRIPWLVFFLPAGVITVSPVLTSGMALRLLHILTGVAFFIVFLWAAPQLTTAKFESARAEGITAKNAESE